MTHEVIAELPDLGFDLGRDDVLAWLETTGDATPAPR
jgi:hypothetical protein